VEELEMGKMAEKLSSSVKVVSYLHSYLFAFAWDIDAPSFRVVVVMEVDP